MTRRPMRMVRVGTSAATRLGLRRSGRDAAVVLAYHDVVTRSGDADGLTVGVDQLRTHLLLLRRLGFRIVPLRTLAGRVAQGRPVAGMAAIVFDDALAGVFRHAAPVLQDLAMPATVAAVSSASGGAPPWWPGSGPLMTRSELREWADAGFGVAAHGRTHASLVGLDASRLHDEVHGARAELEDVLGRRVHDLAYPFGHHDPAVRHEVREAGFETAYTFLNGRITGTEDVYRLPRLTMGRRVDALRLAYHLGRPARTWPDHQAETVAGVEALT